MNNVPPKINVPPLKNLRKAIFFNRDGVLVRTPIVRGKSRAPRTPREAQIVLGVPEVLSTLSQAGYLLIVATNQPDVARGQTSRAEVAEIHAQLMRALPIDEFRVCFHDDSDQCACRKPLSRMICQAAQIHGIMLGASYVVGDRWRDIEAGRRAGCKTIFVDNGRKEEKPTQANASVTSLAEASEIILGRNT